MSRFFESDALAKMYRSHNLLHALRKLIREVTNHIRSMGDSSNGSAVALHPADPGSNPRSGSV